MTGTDTSKIDEQTWRAGAGPEWFRISRYEKTHFLNAAQWATLLEYRREAWLYLQTDRPFESDDDPITSECLAGFYKFMAPIWDDPLLVGSRIDSAPNLTVCSAAICWRATPKWPILHPSYSVDL